jgi:hypothetical protein
MARPQPVRLREAPGDVAPNAHVIDVPYKEVGAGKRSWLGRLWLGVKAVLIAAAIGFLIPPAWVLLQTIADYFAPN